MLLGLLDHIMLMKRNSLSKNSNRSKLRGIFTPENGHKKPEQSSGVLNPFSLNKFEQRLDNLFNSGIYNGVL